ncbi:MULTISPECIES: glycoside hydrolase family 88 protein [unclassified Sphingobacterium]|uniref:glycoside hydrolase family 88 protein n=1 Tax=unclassified Sphingobacterium TaxID=2609468 RepID=UPI00289D8A3F|nr:glycoside hydrolase family 88 protein [Sphingobacterium sp.]
MNTLLSKYVDISNCFIRKRRFIISILGLTTILCAVQETKAQSANQLKKAWDLADRQSQLLYKELQVLKKADSTLASPRTLSENNELVAVKRGDWTSGFYPGVLWYLYEKSGKQKWKELAGKLTATIEDEQYNGKTHDMGFKIFCSVGNGYRLTANPHYRDVIIQSAKTLATRFNPKVGCIRSWDHNSHRWDFPVIIDNMLNLELLFEATKLTGDSSYYQIAVSHANTTMKNHFRSDYSTYHVVDYNLKTGAVQHKNTHQGFSDESTWARGEAWALYGYTMCYRETGNPKYLEQAEQVAHWLFAHPRMPKDLIPYWDFDAPHIPNEPRDVSAASVIASGLLELSTFSDQGKDYLTKAQTIMSNLIDHYMSPPNKNKGFILLHSTGSKPSNSEVDKPLSYADYYFLEALLREENLRSGLTQSSLVRKDPEGKLIYFPDDKGNVIPDFSKVGYHQGNRPLPAVVSAISLSPTADGTDQQMIQRAIDEISTRPIDKNGYRGAIVLKKGTYNIPGSLYIKSSGIVLRGEGDAEGETLLRATGQQQRSLLIISGDGNYVEDFVKTQSVETKYIPVGSKYVLVGNSRDLKEGEQVLLSYELNATWIAAIKMDQIVAREGTKQWTTKEYNLKFERVISAIRGDTLFFDNPVVMAINPHFGKVSVTPFKFVGRIREVGVEKIRFESEFASETDEKHGWIAIEMDKIENAWVRNITARYFGYAAVSLGPLAKQTTVIQSKCLDAKSQITGGRRYSFNNNGQLNLFSQLYTTEGRHDYVTGARTLGPNVFSMSTAKTTHADIGPHHRWAVGTLYDQITTDGEINVQDRGNWGSGHGWAGVTQVLWNCKVRSAAVQQPWASGQNFAIGVDGEKIPGRFKDRPAGFWENQNKKMRIESLYGQQLNDRLNK